MFWNCEEVVFNYESVEEAPLIVLLSDGSGPDEGNDFLFIVINNVIGKYNRYIERFEELHHLRQLSTTKISNNAIHPKTILPGSGGMIATCFDPTER